VAGAEAEEEEEEAEAEEVEASMAEDVVAPAHGQLQHTRTEQEMRSLSQFP
jgi:hypothetical protein